MVESTGMHFTFEFFQNNSIRTESGAHLDNREFLFLFFGHTKTQFYFPAEKKQRILGITERSYIFSI
jgi:hypothetical protein